MKTEKIFILTGAALCVATLFITSHRFVNAAVTPKWLCLAFCAGCAGVLWSMLKNRRCFGYGYAELHGEGAETRGENSYKLIFFIP